MTYVGNTNVVLSLLISIPYLTLCTLDGGWFVIAACGYIWFLFFSPLLSFLQIIQTVNLSIKKDGKYKYQLKALVLVAISYLVFYLGLQNDCYITA